MTYVLFFLTGILGANGIPHFIKGITGERHMTPFGKPSSAVINVIWGSVNFFVAAWIWHAATQQQYSFGGALSFMIFGALLTGIGLALLWQNDAVARGK